MGLQPVNFANSRARHSFKEELHLDWEIIGGNLQTLLTDGAAMTLGVRASSNPSRFRSSTGS